MQRSDGDKRWPPLAAALYGLAFSSWIGGLRLIDPREIEWVMRLDWQYHFLGWHFFRAEPWQWPPGLLRGYMAPMGTAIGFTDSIPLVALILKPFSTPLPNPLQYFGVWLVLCFALQGWFGALLTGLWTRDVRLQVLGGSLFVMMPTLLGRVGHAALASHWLLLWALWMYFREPLRPVSGAVVVGYGLLLGLIHPYLAAMATAIVAALALRRLLERTGSPWARTRAAASPLVAVAIGIIGGWWCAGLLSMSGTDDLASIGIDQFSMNLLGPIAPVGWSSLVPELPLANEFQRFEGFQYLGVGLLALIAVAMVVSAWTRQFAWRAALPLALVALACAVYALSPRVTFGSNVLIDLTTPAITRFAVFRATGRFFWPAGYALVAVAIGLIVSTMPRRVALAVLLSAFLLQWADLQQHYRTLRRDVHSQEFHTWPERLTSDVWHLLLPHYDRVLLYPPEHCGPAAIAFPRIAVLAGTYRLSLNSGQAARTDRDAMRLACRDLIADYRSGAVADDAVYVLHRDMLEPFRIRAQKPVVCGEPDGIPVCVTAHSYESRQVDAGFR